MKVISGDETGLLKLVDLNANVTANFGVQNRDFAVKGLDWSSDNEFASVRENGIVELWKVEDQGLSVSVENQSVVKSPLSVQCLRNSDQKYLCYNADGLVSVESFLPKLAKNPSTFEVIGPLSTCATSSDSLRSVFGGRENDVHMYDLNTFQETWKAKNVPHDKLNLRVPIWITALSFLSPCKESEGSDKVVAGTGHKHVRVYDVKASRQPVVSIDIGDDFRVTAICPSRDGHSVYVGDTSGGLYMWDLRTQRRVYTLKGSTGSIRSLQMNTSGNQVASVGLDRYLRIYNTKNNRLLSSTYLKNRLNCCLIDDGSLLSEKKGSSSDDDNEDDEEEERPSRLTRVQNDRDEDLLEEYADSDDDEQEEEEEEEEQEEEDSDDEDEEDSGDQQDANNSDDEDEEEEEEVVSVPVAKKRALSQQSDRNSKKSVKIVM
jgi:ribosome biogenesis protein NSA1